MNKAKQFFKIIQTINRHPLAGRHRLQSYFKLFDWQISSLFRKSGTVVPFTTMSKLKVKRGMTGATGNIYLGLHEFEDMGFLLHFLRPADLFIDIGANIGSYTVLAAAHVGCPTLAFEPVPSTFSVLNENIRLNKIQDLVKAYPYAVGAAKGEVIVTLSLDTVNHVLTNSKEVAGLSVTVPMVAIDDFAKGIAPPVMMKIDVEGFETEVLAGMNSILVNPVLKAIIIELNGSGKRYGHSDEEIHKKFLSAGYTPYRYDPLTRTLHQLESFGLFNTLYLRDVEYINNRVRCAEKLNFFGSNF